MKSLRAAVVGCGVHGRNGHMTGWKQTDDVDLVAVCDANSERAAAAAQEFGVPHAYADFGLLLKEQTPDVVSVVTPPQFHRQNVIDALASGAHVICEKPLAMNSTEATEMINAAKLSGRLMTMGLQSRMLSQGKYLREFIANGGLGNVYHTRVWAGHLIEFGIPGWGVFHRRDLSGGGVLFATTVHALDFANWVIGNPKPVAASAAEYQKISKMKNPPITWDGILSDCDIEDFSFGLVRFEDGSTMSIESNWLTHPTSRPTGIDILGDFGKATLHPLKIEIEDGKEVKDITPESAVPKSESNGHYFAAVVQDFAECVRESREPIVKFSEMLNVQKIMDAIMESARTNREVSIL